MTDSLILAGSFPTPTREQWLAEVGRALLKGSPDASDDDVLRAFDRKLVSRTDDGIVIQPLYTATDAPVEAPAPGQAPFLPAGPLAAARASRIVNVFRAGRVDQSYMAFNILERRPMQMPAPLGWCWFARSDKPHGGSSHMRF